MPPETETVEGYLIDVRCIRKNARSELHERASTHTSECALMGHCVESGYGVVAEDDRLTLLDPDATPPIVSAVRDSDREEGIRLRVSREERDGKMHTVSVEEV